ncbi:MAG: thiamine biosynthesis protein ApbE [Verrucomicrobiales bacterium VVV1]|nr:MAG: thiamine biosynthesis protein ApbE [Verrucomicrobiales bacterium VVV1]
MRENCYQIAGFKLRLVHHSLQSHLLMRPSRSSPLSILLVPFLAWSIVPSLASESFTFHHENVLGTSLDLTIAAADKTQAAAAETAVLAEVERLRKILSSYDPASELGRLNVATSPLVCSTEMLDVLGSYDLWQSKSRGAFNGHVGELIGLWSKAEKSAAVPAPAEIKTVVTSLASPGWKIDPASGSVTRLSPPQSLNLNSIGKGYIVTKATVAARKSVPGLTGLLVNIGGDIFASGRPSEGSTWEIGVSDPKHSADNAAPLTKVRLVDRAISTSAAYERGYTIAGHRYSHILDPRTGIPAEGVASATVIAANNASANAMATTLCVLKPEEGLELVRSTPGAECLIIAADGRQLRSPGFSALEGAAPTSPAASSGPNDWPSNFQVAIAIDLNAQAKAGRKMKRPFVAVWVEDSTGKRVRTVAVWGREKKYLRDLRAWWKLAQTQPEWAATVTRATRNAGQHRIEWDGKDDQGQPLPMGTYTLTIEAAREHGTYAIQHGPIICGKTAATGTIPAGTEFGETKLTYGPAGQ